MEMIAVQEAFAESVIADNPHDSWERIVVDVEILKEDTGYAFNTMSFAVLREADGELTMGDITLSPETRDAALAIYHERLENAGDTMGSFGLEIDSDGEYRVQISYDAPERLNNNIDGEKTTRLNNYLDTYTPTADSE